jgi:hypothetical protein
MLQEKTSLAHIDTKYIHVAKSFMILMPVDPNMGIPQG